jgi:hypothetical protein
MQASREKINLNSLDRIGKTDSRDPAKESNLGSRRISARRQTNLRSSNLRVTRKLQVRVSLDRVSPAANRVKVNSHRKVKSREIRLRPQVSLAGEDNLLARIKSNNHPRRGKAIRSPVSNPVAMSSVTDSRTGREDCVHSDPRMWCRSVAMVVADSAVGRLIVWARLR